MKVRTMKLKRCKFVIIFMNLISLPIRLPIFILYTICAFAVKIFESCLDIIDSLMWKTIEYISKIFKFDDIAKEQFKTNKGKFIDDSEPMI